MNAPRILNPGMLFKKLGLVWVTKEWFPGMFVIFTSHQWLSSTHPDPQGQQMEVLQKALRGMIDGSLQVHEDIVSRSDDMNLSNTIRQHIAEGFLFFDSRPASSALYPFHFGVAPRVSFLCGVIGSPRIGLPSLKSPCGRMA